MRPRYSGARLRSVGAVLVKHRTRRPPTVAIVVAFERFEGTPVRSIAWRARDARGFRRSEGLRLAVAPLRAVAHRRRRELGKAGGRVVAQGLPVAQAHRSLRRARRDAAPRPRRGGRGFEHAHHRSSFVRGKGVAGDEHPLRLEPYGDVSRRMARSGHDHRLALPSQPVAGIDEAVRSGRRRRGHVRRDLLEQRHLPVGELRRRRGPRGRSLPPRPRRHEAGAASGRQAGGSADVIVVPVVSSTS